MRPRWQCKNLGRGFEVKQIIIWCVPWGNMFFKLTCYYYKTTYFQRYARNDEDAKLWWFFQAYLNYFYHLCIDDYDLTNTDDWPNTILPEKQRQCSFRDNVFKRVNVELFSNVLDCLKKIRNCRGIYTFGELILKEK